MIGLMVTHRLNGMYSHDGVSKYSGKGQELGTRSCTNAQLSNYKRHIAKIEQRCCRRNPSSLAELTLTWKAVHFLSHVRRPASVPHS